MGRRHIAAVRREFVAPSCQESVPRRAGQALDRREGLVDVGAKHHRHAPQQGLRRRPLVVSSLSDRGEFPDQCPLLRQVARRTHSTIEGVLEDAPITVGTQQLHARIEEVAVVRAILERHGPILNGRFAIADHRGALRERFESSRTRGGLRTRQHARRHVEPAMLHAEHDRLGQRLLRTWVDGEASVIEIQRELDVRVQFAGEPRGFQQAGLHDGGIFGGVGLVQQQLHQLRRLALVPQDSILTAPITNAGVHRPYSRRLPAGHQGALARDDRATRSRITEQRVELLNRADGRRTQSWVGSDARHLAVHAPRFSEASEAPAKHIPPLRENPSLLIVVTRERGRRRVQLRQLLPGLLLLGKLRHAIDRATVIRIEL